MTGLILLGLGILALVIGVPKACSKAYDHQWQRWFVILMLGTSLTLIGCRKTWVDHKAGHLHLSLPKINGFKGFSIRK